jgi:hypothetical protein
VIGTLERGGHDATAAKMFLRRLEARRYGTLPIVTDCSNSLPTCSAGRQHDWQPPQSATYGSWSAGGRRLLVGIVLRDRRRALRLRAKVRVDGPKTDGEEQK